MSYIPQVSIENPYVYFDYLQNTHPSTWDSAIATVQSINGKFNSFEAQEKIENAISFLNTIANSQRQGEIAFVQNKINEIRNITKIIKSQELQELTSQLEQILNNYETGFDYKKFSSILNKVLSLENEYKNRLETLKKNFEKNSSRNKNPGLLVDIQNEFLSLIKLLNNEKKEVSKSSQKDSKLSPQVIYNFIIKNASNLNYLDANSFSAGLLKIQIDFRKFLEKYNLSNEKEIGKNYNERIDILNKKFQEFYKNSDYAQLFFSGKIDNSELQKLSKIFGFQDNLTELGKSKKKNISFNFPNLNFTSDVPNFTFTSDITDQSIAEKMSLLEGHFIAGYHTGSINMGDDAILGYISAEYPSEQKKEAINKIDSAISAIVKAEKEFADERQYRERYLSANLDMNTKIEEALNILDKELGSLGTQGFIIHESNKYYETIESGKSGRYNKKTNSYMSGFSGRSLSILNYIDVMRNIGLDFGIDPDSWYFLALNLGEHSPGNGMTNMLEEIFSIAASLIMFDDINVIVKDAAGLLNYSNLTNLHLYRLQNLYIPASYIIQESVNYLKGISNANDAATANILVPKNPYSDYYHSFSKKSRDQKFSNFLNMDSEKKWNTVRDFISSQTKVSIHFFLNFQNFISGLIA